MAEQRTLNPQVLGSNPRGRTAERQVKWKRRSRTVRGTKRDAQRALAELVHDVTTGAVRPADITVEDMLDRWLDFARDDLSPTTLREYRQLLPVVR
jgi:hypothetical protein